MRDGAILPKAAREHTRQEPPPIITNTKASARLPLRKQAPMILVMSGVLFVFAFTLVAQTANCARAAKDISAITKSLKEVRLDNEALRGELYDLESGERIAREAEYSLGMVEPPNALRYVVPPEIPERTVTASAPAADESWVNAALQRIRGY
jgi:cell division protein FtsB